MKNLPKYVLLVFTCLSLFDAGTLLAGGSPKELKIGVLTSMSGPFGDEGGRHGCIGCSQAIANGARLAAYVLNREGGILNRWVTPVVRDTRGTDEGASKAVEELAAEKVFAIIGVHQSEAVLGAAETAVRNKIPLIVTTAAHPALAGKIKQEYAKYRTVFRLGKSLSQWGDMTRLFLEKIAGAKNYYFMGYDAIWNHKLAAYLAEHCNVPCVGASYYPPGVGPLEKDLQEVKKRNPDIVVNGDPGGTAYVEMHHRHHLPGTIFSVGGALANANTIRTLGDAGDRLVFHCGYYDTSGAFYKDFVDFHGFGPLWYCDILAYEAVDLIARAVARTGCLDRERLVQALESGTFEGLCGRYKFDETHQARWGEDYLPGYICQWRDGKARVLYPVKEAPFVRRTR
ncbi:MAG: ABC transporter substrate-binding protein [Syntrophobacteria bacterium]